MRVSTMVGMLVMMFATGAPMVFAQHSCGSHSSDWHQHENDGYWQSWFKIEIWEPDYSANEVENLITDEWQELIRLEFTNDDCDSTTVQVDQEVTFDHSITIDWGGEITASAEGGAKLWFWKCKADVGAKVSWNRTGTSTKTETFSVKQTKGLSECKYIEFYYDIREVHKEYEMDYARARFKCRDHHKNELGGWWYCDARKVTMEGRGYTLQRTGWENGKKICSCENGIAVPLDDDSGSTGDGQ